MKKIKTSLITLFFLFSLASLSAHEGNCECFSSRDYSCFAFQKGDCIYLNQDLLFFEDGKIYLDVGGNPMQIHTLSSDEKGVYISAKGESEKGWTCPICYTYNPPGNLICINFSRHHDFD